MNSQEEQYALSLPYPSASNVKKNEAYGNMILHVYAGEDSEMSAITQYTYQVLYAGEQSAEAARAFMGIAKVEMKHLAILGNLVKKLGVDPQYRTLYKGKPYFWNGAFVEYNKTLDRMILEDIATEKAAIDGYESLIAQIDDEAVTAILKRIVMDEEHHIAILAGLFKV